MGIPMARVRRATRINGNKPRHAGMRADKPERFADPRFRPSAPPRRFRLTRINRFRVLARGKVLRDRDVVPNVELTFVTRLVRAANAGDV